MQTDYWNRVGPTKTFAHPVNIAQLSKWVPLTGRILDYGCGYGRALGILQAHGYGNLIGVDTASAMIAAARQNFPSIPFEVLEGDERVQLSDSSVDAILLFAVLTSVPANDVQRAIVREISRLLVPGGLLYVSDMFLQTDQRNVQRYVEGLQKHGVYGVFDLSEGVTVRHHDRHWFEKLMIDYEPLALTEISVQTMNGHAASAFQWFGRKNFTT